ncbi:MAG: hypothetical protein HYY14_06735, partial [Candidatus Omnitrophica bacterium]|nr:hypothetical protein [Candidatus Omnitrophota bacterium]
MSEPVIRMKRVSPGALTLKRKSFFRPVACFLIQSLIFFGTVFPTPVDVPEPWQELMQAAGPVPAEASQVKKVQSQTAAIADNTLTVQQTITAVAMDKTALLMTVETSELHDSSVQQSLRKDGGEGLGMFSVNFEDAATINIERVRDDPLALVAADLQTNAVEFNNGFRVQTGMTTFSETTYSKNIAILDINASTAAPFYTTRSIEWFADENEAWKFRMTFDTTTPGAHKLVITRSGLTQANQNTSAASITLFWQVLEFLTDTTVTTGILDMAASASSATATVSPTVNAAKSFLMYTYSIGEAAAGREALTEIRGKLDAGGSQVAFNRVGTGTGDTGGSIAWYVVELKDEGKVQRGSFQYGATVYSTTATLSPVFDPERSFAITSASAGTTTGSAQTINMHSTLVRAVVSNESTATFTRRNDADVAELAADVNWQVVEFAPFNVTSPVGNESWQVGTTQNITWTSSSSSKLTTLKLEWNDGSGWATATDVYGSSGAAVTPGSLSFAWKVPSPATEKETDVLVKITNNNASYGYTDQSNANFTIISRVQIIEPNGTELWYVGDTTRKIKWYYWGTNTGNISLEYSIDAPHATWTAVSGATNIAEDTGGSLGYGEYVWDPIPKEASGKTTQVRIKSVTYPTEVVDPSNANFEVRGKITINDPPFESNPDWPTGYLRNIKWTLDATTATVDIHYSMDGGNNFTLIQSDVDADNLTLNVDGTYPWTPPLTQTSNLAKIKVIDSDDADVLDITATFKIIPSLRMIAPDSGAEVWRVNDTQNDIRTLGGGTSFTNVDIYYCTNRSASPIASRNY